MSLLAADIARVNHHMTSSMATDSNYLAWERMRKYFETVHNERGSVLEHEYSTKSDLRVHNERQPSMLVLDGTATVQITGKITVESADPVHNERPSGLLAAINKVCNGLDM